MPSGLHWDQDTMSAKLAAAAAKVPAKYGRALNLVGEDWMSKMKPRTPVKFGNLRSSGHVSDTEVDGNTLSVDLDFGGPAASYAIYVHEDLDAQHTVGQAKFVESVVMEEGPSMMKQVASFVQLGDLF